MGRKKDSLTWEHFEQIDGISKCKYCGAEFRGKPSALRLKIHLLGIEGVGTRICTQVPDHVKNALADASTSSKRPRIDFPEKGVQAGHQSIPNDRLRCIDDVEKMIQSVCGENDLARILESFRAQWAGHRLPVREEVQGELDEFRHRTEPSSSNNEVTSPISTSVPRDNNKSENLGQDGELMQPVAQEQPLSEKEARSDHKLSDNSSNPADTGSKEEKEHEMSRKKDEICMRVPDHVNKPLADDLRKRSPVGCSSSNNEVNNSISTAAPQGNNEFSNQVQDGEMMQLLVQDRSQQLFGGDEMIEKMTSLPFPTAQMVGYSIKKKRTLFMSG